MTDSEIKKFYSGARVFLTGGTGFLGKLAVEKLLRSCGDLEKLYVLVRQKKGKAIEDRSKELFDSLIFARLKREQPELIKKVVFVEGDCAKPDLGLSDKDRVALEKNVNVIFHFAATVRFNEPLRAATYINVRATRDLLKFAKRMPNLKSFVFVSTAYSHCVRKRIGEEFYQTPITGEKLIALVEESSDDFLDQLTPTLVGKWPNTYTFTKAIAEEVLFSLSKGLPVVIVRPSIVASAREEPLPGWTDNSYGVVGIVAGVASGYIRTLYCNVSCVADVVPADYAVNHAIVAGWSVGNKETFLHNPLVLNCVSSPQTPITWGSWANRVKIESRGAPPLSIAWAQILLLMKNYYAYRMCSRLLHHVPAQILDFVALCLGKPKLYVKGAKRIDKLLGSILYFVNNEWNFVNQNSQDIFRQLNSTDKKLFNFDLSNFDWNLYLKLVVRGSRVYILKDPLNTIPEGIKKHERYQRCQYILVMVLCLVFLWMCHFIFKLVN